MLPHLMENDYTPDAVPRAFALPNLLPECGCCVPSRGRVIFSAEITTRGELCCHAQKFKKSYRREGRKERKEGVAHGGRESGNFKKEGRAES